MCGITGIFAPGGHGRIDAGALASMSEALALRGPDDHGLHLEESLGFGFRRLSIMDLSAEANQPFFSEDGSIVLICNGEIYNYRELQRGLLARGHRLRSACDVEVLVHLYEEQGCEFLAGLNGQFALALYDRRQDRLLLARDHVGIAPLFYTETQGQWLFASEIRALLKHPGVEPKVDLTGLDQMLCFPGLVSPRTLFAGIRSLKPGHYLLVDQEGSQLVEYWDLVYPPSSELGALAEEEDCVEELEEKLRQAVAYRLQADVPVGFYLSGGLDSSLIAGLIKSLSAEQRHSFSIGFDDPQIDERVYQQLMAVHLGSTHHEYVFHAADIGERLWQAVERAESPLKDSYNTCSLALSAMVHQSGLKVVLTGEGADELFAGYVGYRLDTTRVEFEQEGELEAQLERELRERLWGDRNFYYERNLCEFRQVREALYAEGVVAQLDQFDCTGHELVDRDKLRGRHPLHQRSYVDFKLRLADHLLADHGDRVAYAHSVEARYPFLDPGVVEFTRTLAPALLLKGDKEKQLLKRLAGRYVPAAVTDRRKFAFVAPGSPALLDRGPAWVSELLSYDYIKKRGYFNPEAVERLKKEYAQPGFAINQTFNNDLLMIVLTFSVFLEVFNMPDYA